MRQPVHYCILGIIVIAVISCGTRPPRFSRFYDVAQDSVYVDLHGYVLPASSITLQSAVKINDKYYLVFDEEDRSYWSGSKDILIEISEKSHESRFIPVPNSVGSFYSISTQNDTLVVRDRKNADFFYDAKSGYWIKAKELAKPSYEDEEYVVQYEEHGEFGDAMWFIDKCSENEYAFVGLSGRVCRLGGVFYIVQPTRIYEVPEPSVGFHCDSLTNYAAAKGVHLLGHHFWEAGYCNDDHNILAIVHYDNEPAGMEKRDGPNGLSYYAGGFRVSEYAKADTTIIGSFIESDTLYCALHTPSGLELAKLDQGKLDLVHAFNLDLGSNHSQYRHPSEYPAWIDVRRYCVCDNPLEERLSILINRKKGLSELIDLSKEGNSFVNIVYDHGGLHPVDSDGFDTILPFYIKNWGNLSFEYALKQENALGGEVSYLNLDRNRNTFAPDSIFKNNERYHIDVITKEVCGECDVQSEYWVKESDKSVVAVFMDWGYYIKGHAFADRWQKYEELSKTISCMLGHGTLVPESSDKMQYTEWSFGKSTLRLYGSDYNVRLIIF